MNIRVKNMDQRHISEQYYSIRVTTKGGDIFVVDTTEWNGTIESLAKIINKATNESWQKIRVFKYSQSLDMQKTFGSRIVGKKRSCLKIDRIGAGSLCTKVDKDLKRNGVVPANVLSFFGVNQK